LLWGDDDWTNAHVGLPEILLLSINLGSELDNASHLFSEGLEVTGSVGLDSCADLFQNGRSVHLKISFNQLKVVRWVHGDVQGIAEFTIAEGFGVDCLADWKTLFELLKGCNYRNHASNGLTDVLLLPGFFEGLNGNIEHQSSLVFLVDANEKVLEAKVTSETLKNALECSSSFLSLLLSKEGLGFLSNNNLSSCLSTLVTKVFPVLVFVVRDGCRNFLGDFNTIEDEVLAEVPGEGLWRCEDHSHLSKLLPIRLDR